MTRRLISECIQGYLSEVSHPHLPSPSPDAFNIDKLTSEESTLLAHQSLDSLRREFTDAQ